MLWSMLLSPSLPTVPLLHSGHPLLLLTEETGPSGVLRGSCLPQRETPC